MYSRSRLGLGRYNSATNWQHVQNEELIPIGWSRLDSKHFDVLYEFETLKLFDRFQSSLLSFPPLAKNVSVRVQLN